MSLWKVAAVQMDCQLGNIDQNLKRIKRFLETTAENGTKLTVFPECALAGYCYRSKEEAWPYAQMIPGPATEEVAKLCKKLDTFVIFGLLEKEKNDLFNSAVCIGPKGVVGCYRKTHLPFLGVDRFVTLGNRPYEVFDLGGLKVGMLICFDGSFPEPCRVLALQGADLIVLPTNWPEGAWCSSSHIPAMRAHENHLYFLSCNRVGIEGGFRFIGRSRITDWNGKDLDYLEEMEEGIIYGELEPQAARQKRVVNVPGEYELDRIASRRPDLYGPLLDSIRI